MAAAAAAQGLPEKILHRFLMFQVGDLTMCKKFSPGHQITSLMRLPACRSYALCKDTRSLNLVTPMTTLSLPLHMFHLDKFYDEDVQLPLRLRSSEPRRSFSDKWVAQLLASGVHYVCRFGTFKFATLSFFPLRALDKNIRGEVRGIRKCSLLSSHYSASLSSTSACWSDPSL
jgi:hypothetical protein